MAISRGGGEGANLHGSWIVFLTITSWAINYLPFIAADCSGEAVPKKEKP